MAYTEQLKRAQLAKLKQRYLDLIEEAGRDKQRAEEENETEKKQLYAEHMLQLRDLPQQLAAEGKSGGMNDSALRGIELAYREGLDALQRMQQQYLDDYSYEVRKQNRLMQLAVDEYLARVASAGKKSSSKKNNSSTSILHIFKIRQKRPTSSTSNSKIICTTNRSSRSGQSINM